jgi:hypothetical protein
VPLPAFLVSAYSKSFSSTRSLGTPEAFFLFRWTQRQRSLGCRIIRSQRDAGAIAILRSEGDGRCALMSPLPGRRLVWSLYGRFWCRSSLEVLRQWRTGARACDQGHVARSAQPRPAVERRPPVFERPVQRTELLTPGQRTDRRAWGTRREISASIAAFTSRQDLPASRS